MVKTTIIYALLVVGISLPPRVITAQLPRCLFQAGKRLECLLSAMLNGLTHGVLVVLCLHPLEHGVDITDVWETGPSELANARWRRYPEVIGVTSFPSALAMALIDMLRTE